MELLKNNKQDSVAPIIQKYRDKKIISMIISYVEKNNQSFTCKDISEDLMNDEGILVDIHSVRKVLKDKMNYSYKRWSSRPLMIDHSNLRVKKALFVVKLLKLIENSTILINIDEATISTSTKVNYSWSPKGIPWNASTIAIKGSIWLITALFSNGISITGIRNGATNSSTFIEYIKHLLAIWRKL